MAAGFGPADPRAMERVTQQVTKEFIEREGIDVDERPHDPKLDRAQQLVYDAWESTSRKVRLELATQALDITRGCADAWVIVAEEAPSVGAALEAYVLGVMAGERALGRDVFEEDAGHFWGLLETRGYMRARAGVAECLWELREYEAALTHYRELLRLNPNDNQGIRYDLLNALLVLERDEEAKELLDRDGYADEASCDWLFGRALVQFRRYGISPASQRALEDAMERNPHVVDYLIGRKDFPADPPRLIELGGESEAAAYVAMRSDAWRATPGAIEWLEKLE